MLFFLLFIVVAPAATDVSPSIVAHGALTPTEIPFHHVATYRVSVEAPEGTQIAITPWAAVPPGLEVTPQDPVETPVSDGRVAHTQDWQLVSIGARTYMLPETIITVDGAPVATLPPETLVVREPTAEEKAEVGAPQELLTLADLEEADPPFAWGNRAVVLAVLLLLGVGVLLGYRRGLRFRRSRVLSAREIAGAQLDALEARLQAGDLGCEALYVGLSEIFRTFLAAYYRVTIQEQSTPEIVNGVLPALPLAQGEADRVRNLLVAFDRVKFAQEAPDEEARMQAVQSVRALVDALGAVEVASAEAASRGAA